VEADRIPDEPFYLVLGVADDAETGEIRAVGSPAVALVLDTTRYSLTCLVFVIQLAEGSCGITEEAPLAALQGYPRPVAAASILVVDDDAPIRRMLQRTLAAEGHDVSTAADGGAALAAVERAVPDLVVLDVAMPGLDGFAVCRRLRAKGLALPILLLTARDAVPDRVAGLDAGADDYLVKPFAAEELVARVRALLRRGLEPAGVLAHGDLVLDLTARSAHRGGRELTLSGRELDLLELLLRNPRRVVTRELALERVWGGVAAASPNVVDRYVSYLRRKLGEPPLIETVRGAGFLLRA
jgi:two-component system, OmpR family, response regulator MprA